MSEMTGLTSPSLAACVIALMIPAYACIALRIWIRIKRKAWGNDDWCMVAAIPPFTVLTVSELAMAFTGLGVKDAELGPERVKTGLLWWFIFQTNWCFTAVPLKWSICFTLCRIASGRKVYIFTLYIAMAAVAIVMLATAFYEFAACKPIQFWWDHDIPGGYCLDPTVLTGFSFALSAVSILTDWYCAVIPIPLLWNVQMEKKLKASVACVLGLAAVASVSAIVRLGITVNLSSTSDFLYHNNDVAIWSYAEAGLGAVVTNLPALRPLFEKYVIRYGLSSDDGPSGMSSGWKSGSRGPHNHSQRDYVEMGRMNQSSKGMETNIRGMPRGRRDSSLEDSESQKHIVAGSGIMVNKDIQVSHENSGSEEHFDMRH